MHQNMITFNNVIFWMATTFHTVQLRDVRFNVRSENYIAMWLLNSGFCACALKQAHHSAPNQASGWTHFHEGSSARQERDKRCFALKSPYLSTQGLQVRLVGIESVGSNLAPLLPSLVGEGSVILERSSAPLHIGTLCNLTVHTP